MVGGMFWLHDARTGRAEEITAPPGRVLRMFAGGPPAYRPAHIGELRTLVLADLIVRNAEHRHGLAVRMVMVVPGPGRDPGDDDAGGGASRGYGEGFSADATALNLRPAERVVGPSAEPLDGVAEMITTGHVLIETRGTGPGSRLTFADGPGREVTWVRAGPLLFEGRTIADPVPEGTAPEVSLADVTERGLDPLALRLAYLSSSYREQAELTWDVLSAADEDLRRWRKRVAEWAESPSKPMCAEVTARVAAAFDEDLDAPGAVRALWELEQDADVPPGSKFESFVHADQLLGLDLPRDIGRTPLSRNDSPS
jgi:hypothetical protein